MLVEEVANCKYLGQPLNQMYDEWPAVCRNVKGEQMIWGILVKVPQREGADTKVAAMFYRVVLQVVLLLG